MNQYIKTLEESNNKLQEKLNLAYFIRKQYHVRPNDIQEVNYLIGDIRIASIVDLTSYHDQIYMFILYIMKEVGGGSIDIDEYKLNTFDDAEKCLYQKLGKETIPTEMVSRYTV